MLVAADRRAYMAWRATVPWRNAEVREAARRHRDQYVPGSYPWNRIESYIEWTRQHHIITKKLVRLAVPYLVTTCFCGRRALYRYGVEGRCRAHRDVVPAGWEVVRRARDQRSAAMAAEEDDINRIIKRVWNSKGHDSRRTRTQKDRRR